MIEISIQNPDPSIPLKAIKAVIQSALDAAEPSVLVTRNLDLFNTTLRVGDYEYKIHPSSRIVLISLGKAAMTMAKGVEEKLNKRIDRGICVCKHRSDEIRLRNFTVIESSHPVPDEHSVIAALNIKKALTGLKKEDVVLLMLSGGGSALACLPAEGISLADIQQVTSQLLRSGASIGEMNIVRKHLDVFKGGGFLRMAQPAQVGVLVLSDVIGNPLDVIASGPAIIDPSTYTDALDVVKKHIPFKEIPSNIRDLFGRESKAEVLRSERISESSGLNAYHKVIGSNQSSVDAAVEQARILGFNTEVVSYDLRGEARLAWNKLLQHSQPRPFAIFAGGETTVTVKGSGLGGRNLELALGAVETISAERNLALVAFATDGEDGPTDAAGVVVNQRSMPDKEYLDYCLRNNDSYNYFKKAGGLLLTGSTGTNVNDISFLIGY